MENLNKENFFNELQEKYPEGMKIFCDWIDEYKKRVGWVNLFAERAGTRPEAHKDPFFNVGMSERQKTWDAMQIKFHHIPIAMQNGILTDFAAEMVGEPPLDIRKEITTMIEALHLGKINS